MQPDVTVLIAAYNAEATLAAAIRSALDQRGVSLEIVVVDDASSDRTVEIARSFDGAPVRVFSLNANRGPGGARNAGLDEARGRWIAVLDSDDTMEPGRLSRMIARGSRTGSQIVVDNLFVDDGSGIAGKAMYPAAELARHDQLTLVEYILRNRLFEETYNYGYMKPVFEREFLRRTGLRYDEVLRIGEDFLMIAGALALGACCAIEPEAGYVYGIRDGSISRTLEIRHLEAILEGDERFKRSYSLDAAALRALGERRRCVEQAVSYLSVVRHLKERSVLQAILAACRDPGAMRYLRLPIGVRLRRLAGVFG